MEPANGSVEAEAFRRITEYGRHDFVRVHEARERDHSYARFQERPFPGNPITAGLTNHEAAELSGRLYSAHTVSGKLPTVTETKKLALIPKRSRHWDLTSAIYERG